MQLTREQLPTGGCSAHFQNTPNQTPQNTPMNTPPQEKTHQQPQSGLQALSATGASFLFTAQSKALRQHKNGSGAPFAMPTETEIAEEIIFLTDGDVTQEAENIPDDYRYGRRSLADRADLEGKVYDEFMRSSQLLAARNCLGRMEPLSTTRGS